MANLAIYKNAKLLSYITQLNCKLCNTATE